MADRLNVLSLFSGIGGLELGLERAGMTVVGQVEIDNYCRRILAKHWPNVPRHNDVRTAAEWWLSTERPTVDVVCGGFPCQDISNAGQRAGIIDGERSSLWTYLAHTVRRVRPRYVVMENVAAILVRGLDVVAADLAEIGYDVEWDCIPAAAVGAHHRRDRWFGIAYPQRQQLRLEPIGERGGSGQAVARSDGAAQPVAHAEIGGGQDESPRTGAGVEFGPVARAGRGVGGGSRPAGDRIARGGAAILAPDVADPVGSRREDVRRRGTLTERAGWRTPDRSSWWDVEPRMGRVVDGVPAKLDRARRHALGNAVVPQVAEYVGRLIVEHASAAA